MINILCDNKNFVVCEKPSGLISELSDDHNISLPAILSKQLGDTELFTVHRLDKDVSGIIVYAKNQQTAAKLSNQISENKFEKEYVAIVSKKVNPEEMELCHLLYHDRAKNKTYTVKRKRNGVKEIFKKPPRQFLLGGNPLLRFSDLLLSDIGSRKDRGTVFTQQPAGDPIAVPRLQILGKQIGVYDRTAMVVDPLVDHVVQTG